MFCNKLLSLLAVHLLSILGDSVCIPIVFRFTFYGKRFEMVSFANYFVILMPRELLAIFYIEYIRRT